MVVYIDFIVCLKSGEELVCIKSCMMYCTEFLFCHQELSQSTPLMSNVHMKLITLSMQVQILLGMVSMSLCVELFPAIDRQF